MDHVPLAPLLTHSMYISPNGPYPCCLISFFSTMLNLDYQLLLLLLLL
jgi:hypothetical protein